MKKTSLDRRQILVLGGKSVAATSFVLMNGMLFQACGGSKMSSATGSGSDSSDAVLTPGGSCATEIPSETDGPYPAHDDSAINCLRLDGIVRSDIRTSLGTGSYTGTATAVGVPLTLTFTVTRTGTCEPLAGYAVYLWHADAAGRYSMYTSGVTSQTYLRGVQATDVNGELTFTTVVPGCYEGRYPHMHFDVYPSLALAVDSGNVVKTSQLTFPEAMMDESYATANYSSSVGPYSRVSLSSDGIFSDGYSTQMTTVAGDVSSGYSASILIGV